MSDQDGPWALVDDECCECGKRLAIVATVKSLDEGYAEVYLDGKPRCSACRKALIDRVESIKRNGPPPQHPLIRRVCECECVPRAPDEDAERVQKIRDAMNRHLAGLQKAINDALDLVEERKKAA